MSKRSLFPAVAVAVVGLGFVLSAGAWAGSTQSSKVITLIGRADDSSNTNELLVLPYSDERFPGNDTLGVTNGEWYCFGSGAELASIFDFKVNPTLSTLTISFSTAGLSCFPSDTPPTSVTMTCSVNGIYFDNSVGNGSSNFGNGLGNLVKYHVTRRGNSVDCSGVAGTQSYPNSGGGLLYYDQYVSH